MRKRRHIVISHCKNPLDWVDEFTIGYDVASIHVIAKCGEPMSKIKASSVARIDALPNIGRCDHACACHIANVVPTIVQEDETDNSIIIFLKYDISAKHLHESGEWTNFEG